MEASKAPGYIRVGDINVAPQHRPTNHTALDTAGPAQSAHINQVNPPKLDTHSGAKQIWNHILPFLPLSLDPDIFDSEVIRLFALPLLQRVQWKKTWMKRRLDNDPRQLFAILAHVVGVDRNSRGEKPCSLCIRGEGPFEGCWILPRAAAWESHQYATGCANCLFIHKKAACSVKYSWESRCDRRPGEKIFPGSPPPVVEWAASAIPVSGSGQSKKRQLSPSDVNGEPLAQRRRQERDTASDDEDQTGAGKRSVTSPVPLSGMTTRASNLRARKAPSPESQTARSKSYASDPSSALVMAGLQTSGELLEMEDWEVAPGRIREDGAAQANSKSLYPPYEDLSPALRNLQVHLNLPSDRSIFDLVRCHCADSKISDIAFSKSFLENNQSVPVAADVSFRVDTIKSGHKLEFEELASYTRYCSVASGKVRVTIAGQPEFIIGPHGVFKIKPGVKASAQNRLYIDSVVHVVSVRE
jgi:hypothetical protein